MHFEAARLSLETYQWTNGLFDSDHSHLPPLGTEMLKTVPVDWLDSTQYAEDELPACKYEFMLDDNTFDMDLGELLYSQLLLRNYGQETWRLYIDKIIKPRKRYRMKYCTHIRKSRSNDKHTATFLLAHSGFSTCTESYSGFEGWIHRRIRPVFEIRTASLSESVLPSEDFESPLSRCLNPSAFFGSDLNKRCQRKVLEHAIPDMEDGFSLPVFVGELKDLPRMLRGLLNIIKKAPTAIRQLFASPFKEWSKHQLSVSFGWIPFVRDIETMITRFLNLREDVLDFIAESGKRKSYHYTIRLTSEDIDTIPEEFWDRELVSTDSIDCSLEDPPWSCFQSYIDSIDVKHYRQRSISSILYTATIDYTYTIEDIGPLAPILAGLDRFGLNFSLSDVWELIPFSFVVDWIFDVQSLVETLDYTNLPAQLVINEYCESLKFAYAEHHQMEIENIQFYGHTWKDPWEQWVSDGWTFTPVSTSFRYTEDVYYRRTDSPSVNQTDFPGLTCPKGMQIVLGSALIGSRM